MKCHCGRPLHYSDPDLQAKVERLIADVGEVVPVTVIGHGTYLVPRHYIALHGITGRDVPRLGFPRIEDVGGSS